MPKANTKLKTADWQVTATSMYCDFIDDFVTIIVNNDWSIKCCWYNQHNRRVIDDKRPKFDKKISLKMEKCRGPQCIFAINYLDKLRKEEHGA